MQLRKRKQASLFKPNRYMLERQEFQDGVQATMGSRQMSLVIDVIEIIDTECSEFGSRDGNGIAVPMRTLAGYTHCLEVEDEMRYSFNTWLGMVYAGYQPHDYPANEQTVVLRELLDEAGFNYFDQAGLFAATSYVVPWEVAKDRLLDFVDSGTRLG